MSKVTIYTTDHCPYCIKAKNLLKRKGVNDFVEIDVTHSDDLTQEMIRKSGGRKTVPQIFIGDTHVGGCDDLHALESAGKLSALLAN